jgi:hypothetical protein
VSDLGKVRARTLQQRDDHAVLHRVVLESRDDSPDCYTKKCQSRMSNQGGGMCIFGKYLPGFH